MNHAFRAVELQIDLMLGRKLFTECIIKLCNDCRDAEEKGEIENKVDGEELDFLKRSLSTEES